MNDDRIFAKIDKIEDHLNSIDKTLVQQHETLKDHTRRSLANEEALEILKTEFKPIVFQYTLIRVIYKSIIAILASGLIIELLKLLSEKGK